MKLEEISRDDRIIGIVPESDVYLRLLRKLETVRGALDDKVFDVLGHPGYFEKPLRDLIGIR